ncbi:MAG: DUF4912 domain-containing protein [Candidatus Omnitrophota bacterium]|jgi:hypothetical protein
MVRAKKIKKVVSKKPISRKRQTRITKFKAAPRPQAKQTAGIQVQEIAVETAKFSHPEISRTAKTFSPELPSQYEQDRMVLLVRDPWWLYTYWELKQETVEKIKSELKDEFYKAKRILRVYDVTNIIFDGLNAHRFFDIEIHEFANNWYIDTAGPGKSWCVDLGLRLSNGKFITILRSNVVQTPLDGPSWITDEEWMIPDDMFARLYGLGFGQGKSSPAGKAWRERMVSSSGMASMASPVKKAQERGFWLKVDCELIVYGATLAGAKVTVQGKPINLRPDGTFTLRFALPDGKQVIPVKAVSADKVDERTITPTVNKGTK